MNIDAALRLASECIHGAEGFSADAYLDQLCKPARWTIGFGTTRIDNDPVHAGMHCTREQAEQWARADLRSAAEDVLSAVTVPMTSCQLGALTSFCYNIGAGRFAESSVLDALNRGLYRVAADRLLEYDEADHHHLAGLDTRRARERALFLQGTFAPGLPTTAVADRIVDSPTTDQLNQAELDSLNPS